MNLHFADQTRELIELPLTEPLLIRLTEDVAKVPAGITLELSNIEARALVRRGLAQVIGSLTAQAQIVMDDDDMERSGLASALWGAA
ncbi:MAG: hypothetical protein WBW84_19485 [Acidobacteriaceae bacterium]